MGLDIKVRLKLGWKLAVAVFDDISISRTSSKRTYRRFIDQMLSYLLTVNLPFELVLETEI